MIISTGSVGVGQGYHSIGGVTGMAGRSGNRTGKGMGIDAVKFVVGGVELEV